MGLLTSGTFGPTSSISSASADLSMSLANRLQAGNANAWFDLVQADLEGMDTPSGLCRLRQRASVRRTSESGPTGWPTPVANTNPQPETKRGLQHVSGAAINGMGNTDNEQHSIAISGCGHEYVSTGREQDPAASAGLRGDYRPLRLTVFGEMRTGSFVEMANGVQLNPAHSRWLMGLPHAWDESSPGWQEWQAATASAA
jgi:hypothetical protein